MVRAIVLDIEGTTSSTSFVYETLYPYARARLAGWIDANPDAPELADVRRLSASGAPGDELPTLERWMDTDDKVTPLKGDPGLDLGRRLPLRGADLALLSRRHPGDAAVAWRGSFPVPCGCSPLARCAHSRRGSATALTATSVPWSADGSIPTTPGRSGSPAYRKIGEVIGVASGEVAFLSDVSAELDAARRAGWQTIGVRRKGDKWYAAGVGDHVEVASFEQVVL